MQHKPLPRRLNEDSSPEELALFNALLHYVDAAGAADFGN